MTQEKTLNIGCGKWNRESDEIGIDIEADCKPTVRGDAQALPFKSETFEKVSAIHVLEHVPNIIKTVEEVWRVLKPNGKFLVRVPLFPTLGSICDPTHVRYFVDDSLWYFCEKGLIPSLKHHFKMENMFDTPMSDNTVEIICQMRK